VMEAPLAGFPGVTAHPMRCTYEIAAAAIEQVDRNWDERGERMQISLRPRPKPEIRVEYMTNATAEFARSMRRITEALKPKEGQMEEQKETTVTWTVQTDDPRNGDGYRYEALYGRGLTAQAAAENLKEQLDAIAATAIEHLDGVDAAHAVLKKSQRVTPASKAKKR
jgi:hypothetical protein